MGMPLLFGFGLRFKFMFPTKVDGFAEILYNAIFILVNSFNYKISDVEETINDASDIHEYFVKIGLCHLARVALDASDQSMAIGAVLGAVILLLDDDSLLACVLAREDNAHLAGFHEFDHDEEFKPSSVPM